MKSHLYCFLEVCPTLPTLASFNFISCPLGTRAQQYKREAWGNDVSSWRIYKDICKRKWSLSQTFFPGLLVHFLLLLLYLSFGLHPNQMPLLFLLCGGVEWTGPLCLQRKMRSGLGPSLWQQRKDIHQRMSSSNWCLQATTKLCCVTARSVQWVVMVIICHHFCLFLSLFCLYRALDTRENYFFLDLIPSLRIGWPCVFVRTITKQHDLFWRHDNFQRARCALN